MTLCLQWHAEAGKEKDLAETIKTINEYKNKTTKSFNLDMATNKKQQK